MMIDPQIVFEDDELLILNKPSGWVVNDSTTVGTTPVVQNWLSVKDFKLAGSMEYRSGIVHRLDKETSGVLIVAKNENAFKYIQLQFKKRIVKKKYLALLHGKVELQKGHIVASVGRLPWNRERFGVLPGGRDATTEYNVKRYYRKEKDIFSLVEFYPKTGRTHQIRIHAKYLGHTVVGDEFYAGRKTARRDRMWCPRLFLHASTIKFQHPRTKESVEYRADLPDELENVLNGLVKL